MKKTIILSIMLISLYAGFAWAGGLNYWIGFSVGGGGGLVPPISDICEGGYTALTDASGIEIIDSNGERICCPE